MSHPLLSDLGTRVAIAAMHEVGIDATEETVPGDSSYEMCWRAVNLGRVAEGDAPISYEDYLQHLWNRDHPGTRLWLIQQGFRP